MHHTSPLHATLFLPLLTLLAPAACDVGDTEPAEDDRGGPAFAEVPPDNQTRNPSFESNLSGWMAWQATLARVPLGGAPQGTHVVTVTHETGASFTIDDEPASVTSTAARKVYAASAWVRAASPSSRGKPASLRVREHDPTGALVQEWSSRAVPLTDEFQRLSVDVTAVNDGDTLDLRISQGSAAPGDAFHADLIVLQPLAIEPAEQRPFDPDHPVYQPIPPDCPLYVHSSKIVAHIAREHAMFGLDAGAESPAVYVSEPSDPVWTLNVNGKRFRVHAPAGIRQGTGDDAPVIVLDRASPEFGGHPVEYRVWHARIDRANRTVYGDGVGVGVYANDGRTIEPDLVQPGRVPRALGMAELSGQNTGSGNSYTVGMIRPIDVRRGRIDHAIRVAIAYPHSGRWFWPALRTEQQSPAAAVDENCPMGCRIFLDPSVDVDALADRVAARLSDPRNKAFARMIVVALQQYGLIALDGTTGNNNIYMESDSTANWEPLIGPTNSYGTYNHIARAIAAELPWHMLRVADGSVFEDHGR